MTFFYWERTMLAKWSPVLSSDRPGKPMGGGKAPRRSEIVELPGDIGDYNLFDVAENHPAPKESTNDV